MRDGVLGRQQRDRHRVVHRLGDVEAVVAQPLHPLGVRDDLGEAQPRVHARVDPHAGGLSRPVLWARPRAMIVLALGGEPGLVEVILHPAARPVRLGLPRRLAGERPDGVVHPPDLPHVVARDRSHAGRDLPGALEQALVRHHLGDEAPRERGRGVDEVTREAHPPGPVDADQLGQADDQPGAGHGADPGVRVGEAGPLRGDQEVTVQRDLQATGDRGAVDGTDDRRLVRREEPEVRGGPALAVHLVLTRLGRQRLEVDAGAEGRVGAGQHHARHVVAAVEVRDGLVQLPRAAVPRWRCAPPGGSR